MENSLKMAVFSLPSRIQPCYTWFNVEMEHTAGKQGLCAEYMKNVVRRIQAERMPEDCTAYVCQREQGGSRRLAENLPQAEQAKSRRLAGNLPEGTGQKPPPGREFAAGGTGKKPPPGRKSVRQNRNCRPDSDKGKRMKGKQIYGKTKLENVRSDARTLTRELLLISLMLAAFFAALFVILNGCVERPTEKLVSLTGGWYYVEDGVRTEVTLPAVITCEDGTLELCHDGIGEEYAGCTVTLRGAQYNLTVLLGDEVLYDYEEMELFPRNAQMKSKLDCDAEIPLHAEDGTLKLCMESANGRFRISSVQVGDGQTVATAHFQSAAFMLIADIAMIVLGIVCAGAGIYLRMKKMGDGRFGNLAAFFFICAVWRLTDSSLVQNGSAYPEVVCLISFYMFMLLAVPMLHFLQKTVSEKPRRIMNIGIAFFYINAAAQGVLNSLGLFSFVRMLFVTHLLLAFWVFICIVLLLKERKKNPDWETTLMLLAFLFPGVSGVLALLLYWLWQVPYYGAIFEAGIMVFLVLVLVDAVVKMAQNIRAVTEMRVYLRLQREDWLTGFLNRQPFEEELDRIQSSAEKLDDVLLIFLDISHLRRYNNEYGRTAGDGLILAAARCIQRIFGKYGLCYRLSGDEFGVLLYGSGLDEAELFDSLEQEIESFNSGSRFKLSMAKGASHLRDGNGYLKRISDWKYEADTGLYQDSKQFGGSRAGSGHPVQANASGAAKAAETEPGTPVNASGAAKAKEASDHV